jgi:hyperosmotically inducible protein
MIIKKVKFFSHLGEYHMLSTKLLSLIILSTVMSAPATSMAAEQATDADNNMIDTTEQYSKDAWITTKVKTAIIEESEFPKGFEISVKTENGKVFLSGDVESQELKNLAEKTAKEVEGVTAVENNLTIKK